METHHWEIHARIFGIIQFFNLVSLPSTNSYYQFFKKKATTNSFPFFFAIYYFYLLLVSLSHYTHTYLVELLWFADHFDMAI